jgi:putative addiction module component (TIGR02574 family)
MKTDNLIQEIQSLPVDERARLADCVLRSLNQTLPAIDQKWAELASQRLRDIQAEKVTPVPAADVFNEIWHRFG